MPQSPLGTTAVEASRADKDAVHDGPVLDQIEALNASEMNLRDASGQVAQIQVELPGLLARQEADLNGLTMQVV